MGGTRPGQRPGRRLTQREAAEVLGISPEAVRKRIKRGTLPSEKGEDGRRYVWVDTAPDESRTEPEVEGTRALVEEMRGRIESLERQLERAEDRDRENRRIIAALTQRIPEIEAPRSPQESPEEASEGSATPEPSEPHRGDPRPWWRRWFE